jgi:hypothetical protein
LFSSQSTTEAEFQERLRLFLRSQPNIGSQLEEHPRSTGGITDLSYKGIRLELKSEPNKRLTLADCQQFVGQAASYAVEAITIGSTSPAGTASVERRGRIGAAIANNRRYGPFLRGTMMAMAMELKSRSSVCAGRSRTTHRPARLYMSHSVGQAPP